MHTPHTKTSGFTLIEMLIATTIFVVVTVSAISSMLILLDGARNTRGKYAATDSLNISLETMARLVRTGSNFHCTLAGNLAQPQDCPYTSANNSGGPAVAFTDQDGRIVQFKLTGTRLQEDDGSGAGMLYITPVEVAINRFRVYVTGAPAGDGKQPYMTIVINGYFKNGSAPASEFNIQTSINQSLLDS